jgi:hypothetical protein
MADVLSGIDSSSPCTQSSLDCLKENGIKFVGRYYSRTTKVAGKKLTQAEAQLISQNGLEIVAVYEDGPTSASYFSAARGTADANGAMQQAAAIGQPAGSAIYFTVDYDAEESDITGCITAYFQAVRAAIGDAFAVGVYGSGATCTAIMAAQLADFAWLAQSTGWSGYTGFANWAIKQGPEKSVCGLNSDLDDAHGDCGSFTV